MRYARLVLLFATVAILLVASGRQHAALADPPPMFGDGSDGAITFSPDAQFNPPADGVVNSGTAGGTALTVSSVAGLFQPGQAIMIHQTRGTGAGDWELNTVQSYALGNLTTVDPLAYTYSTSGANAAQVLVVPQYTNVTVDPGVTVSAKPWDGAKGGIVAFFANGTVTVDGTISADGRGFRGGAEGQDDAGWTGEGTGAPSTIYPQPQGMDPPGNGGGFHHVSSAGGGHATAIFGSEGTVGSASGTADLTVMTFGGAGAGGASYNTDGVGGRGGGAIAISCSNMVSAGTITSNGSNGGSGGSNARSGAGGGGGAILIRCQTATFGVSLISAAKGLQGAGGQDSKATDGSDGRIRVEYCTSISGGIAEPPASIAQISCAPPDSDGDGVPDASDNCPSTANAGQQNNVHPGTTPGDHCEDPEPDGVFDINDNCPDTANAGRENNVHSGTFAGDHCEDPEPDGVFDINDNCPDTANAGQENNVHPLTSQGDHCEDPEPDGVFDVTDNCPDAANPGQENFDGDALGDVCDPDNDNDGVPNVAEGQCRNPRDDDGDGRMNDGCPQVGSISEATIAGACDPGNAVNDDPLDDNFINDGCPGLSEVNACGSDDLSAASVPERVDGAFAGQDDEGDGDTDEALPAGSEGFDCDGDGWTGTTESHVFTPATDRDQDPCGGDAWAADLVGGSFSGNRINIQDLASFVTPVRRLNTSSGDAGFDQRWDLVPGSSFGETINVQDMASLIVVRPPMFGGMRAYNGPECPWPP